MKVKEVVFILMILGLAPMANAQEEIEKFRRHHITAGIGHAHIPSSVQAENNNRMVSIPSWGLGYEFLFTPKFGLGLKNDLEAANYVIEDNEGNELERENPFSSSLVLIYYPIEGLSLFAGPGIEFEKEENLAIFIAGIGYEIEIDKRWDITPELFYELKGGHTSVIGFGLAFGFKP